MTGVQTCALPICALGGALSAKEFYEAVQNMREQGATGENIAQLVGGTGGLFMAIPHPVAQGVGATLVGGSMAYPYVKQALSD